MKTNKDIDQKVKSTLDAFETVEHVSISPFFKDKMMNRLFLKKEEKQSSWSWFTPQLQFAMLALFIVVNVLTLTQLENDSTNDAELDEFAQTYDLLENEVTSIFN